MPQWAKDQAKQVSGGGKMELGDFAEVDEEILSYEYVQVETVIKVTRQAMVV